MVTAINLVEVFCAEAHRRLETVQRALAGTDGSPVYDQLHQEFDTLSGAARACNLPDWEHWCRLLARLSRHLHRQRSRGVDPAAQRLLEQAMGLLHAAKLEARRSGITPAALGGSALQSLEQAIVGLLNDQ